MLWSRVLPSRGCDSQIPEKCCSETKSVRCSLKKYQAWRLAAQEGVGRGDGFPFQVSELATGRRGHFESSMEDRREAAGRVAGGGQSLSWGGRGSPLRVHLSAFFPVLVLGHWRRQEKLGRGRGRPKAPCPLAAIWDERVGGQNGQAKANLPSRVQVGGPSHPEIVPKCFSLL